MERQTTSDGKRGLNINMTEIIIGVAVALAGGGTIFGFAGGASRETAQDMEDVIRETYGEMKAFDAENMTMEEAEVWRREQDRIDFVDESIKDYAQDKQIVQTQLQVFHERQNVFQKSMDENELVDAKQTELLESIAKAVNAEP